MIKAKTFREDLFYRVKQFSLVAAVLSDSSELQPADLTPHLQQAATPVLPRALPQGSTLDEVSIQGNFNPLLREMEQKMINVAMKKCGSESAAAKYLGIPRSTLGDIRKRLRAKS